MNYQESGDRIAAYRREIAGIRAKMRALQTEREAQAVRDYEFSTPEETKRLSELFGRQQDLIVIHNMGKSCPYCTLWADGYNGVYEHLANRAAFIVMSPDPPAVQREFAASRGWKFPMVSHAGTSFAEDMGYRAKNGGWMPGISVFRRQNGRILRLSDAAFDQGDDFCIVWHILDLFPEGKDEWQPKYRYGP
jgi:predicted dithiol-disulfide oxidoreductase (DUF899 family)